MTKYFSATKLVESITDSFKANKLSLKPKMFESIQCVHLWFKGDETFINNKFVSYCIKYPLAMTITTTANRNLFFKYDKLTDVFNAKPIICFAKNCYLKTPNDSNYYKAIVCFTPDYTTDGFPFYPITIEKEAKKNRIDTLKNIRH